MSHAALERPHPSPSPAFRVAIVGPGAVGGYLAVCLSSACVPVVLVGRRNTHLTMPKRAVNHEGRVNIPGHLMVQGETPGSAACVLVTVKSRDTERVATLTSAGLSRQSLVVSLQNGLHNRDILRRALGPRVAAGVVGFNVLRDGTERRQTTRGKIFLENVAHPAFHKLVAALRRGGLSVHVSSRIHDLMAGKLLLNLHNGVSACLGMSIRETLRDRRARWCYARCFVEGLAVIREAGMRPRTVLPVPLDAVGMALGLPGTIMNELADRLVQPQHDARSSTLIDLERGVPTEIDVLNGEIVALAARDGRIAPANRAVCDVVKSLEQQQRPRFLRPRELEQRIRAALRHPLGLTQEIL